MVQRWLVHTEEGIGYRQYDLVQTFESERDATAFIGKVATGQREDTRIRHIYKVDLSYGTIKEYVPQLQDMKLRLVEKPKAAQDAPAP
jgi:hypothetical protein